MQRLRIHVLSLAPLSTAQKQRLETLGELVYYDATLDDPDDDEGRKCRGADILVVTPRLSQDVVAVLDRCRLISVQAIGTDSINLASASRKGIAVCNVPSPPTADAVAEHAFALLLSMAKRLEEGRRILCSGSWRTGIAYKTVGLAGKTLGIVGFGRIGQRIASIAAGFKLRVAVCDIDPAKTLVPTEGVEFADFSGVLEVSDFVVLAVPATPETEGMINSSTLAKMKPSALLINVARGNLVVESDLVEALRKRTIAGAGIDVFVDEPPPPEHPFFSLENVIVSPHVAGATDQAISYLLEKSIANVEAFVKGKPINVVNPEVLKVR